MTSPAANYKTAGADPPIRVLIVDDSAVARRMVADALDGDPEIEVAGTAANGAMALVRIPQCDPDVVTMDIEMQEMGGLEALKAIRRQYPRIRVIIFSSQTEPGSAVALEALSLGASDYLTKRFISRDAGGIAAALRPELTMRVKQYGRASRAARTQVQPAPLPHHAPQQHLSAPGTAPRANARAAIPEVFVIGISTGGPTALHEILPTIPGNFPLPVLIVQHMPPTFTRLLAERLSTSCAIPVHEARDGMPIEAGRIYIAPGDFHMRATGPSLKPKVALDKGPPENSCRPAVDVLFRSASEVWGAGAIAAVLTGMGSDGQLGCEVLRAKGAFILAQDEATSVVWGMPGGVVKAGLADKILPLKSIIPEVIERCHGMTSPLPRMDPGGARK